MLLLNTLILAFFLFPVRVFNSLSEVENLKNCAVTTGTFDGVHAGHRVIIQSLIKAAKKIKGESLIATFHPHPRVVLQQSSDLKLITTLEEKIELLSKTGVDNLLVIPFTKEFSRLSSLDFVRDILVTQLDTKQLVIGYDHHFGRNREGSFEHLLEFGPLYGFDVQEIPVQLVNEVNVSSTKIRLAIENSDFHTAREFLGYYFFITGEVVEGNKLGRELGFPTANLKVNDPYKLIPSRGVYAVKVLVDEKSYQGMLNIGIKPSVEGNNEQTIEVNLFNFSGDLYGKSLRVEFRQKMRDEIKFSSLEELKAQLNRDKLNSIKILTH